MIKFAIFINFNDAYIPYLNVLLNSMEYHKIYADVFLMYYGECIDYVKGAIDIFNFNIIPIEIKKEDFVIDEFNKNNNNLFIKQSRFRYIREFGLQYDAIAMLDADMFIVSEEFMSLFNLVSGTNKLIGCNEKFKWVFSNKYIYKEKPILEHAVKAYKFHCSVPIIFDLKEWISVFDFYNKIAYNSFEKINNCIKPIGDIYCWNISVYKNNRQDDVVIFPMQTMTQVHHTYALPWAGISKQNDGKWITNDGEHVYSIHGRIGKKSWEEGQLRGVKKCFEQYGVNFSENFERGIKNIFRTIQKEWYNFNFNYKLNLYDFFPKNDYWESLK
jgi:hypothetical protein